MNVRAGRSSRAARGALAWLGAAALACASAPGGPPRPAAPVPPRSRALALPPPSLEPVPGSAFQAELAAGRFLVASRRLGGPFFAKTVVLLLEYGPGGAMGLVVNRPTRVPLARLLPDVEGLSERHVAVFVGGPVSPQALLLLLRSDHAPADAAHVLGDVYASGSLETLRRLVEAGETPARFRAFAGYSGWAPRQLDAEVARGDWYVVPAEPDRVFADPVSELWERLVFEYGGLQARAR